MDIRGQTALITGASSGIGKACAEQFAALGINLILTARRLDRLESLAKELSSKHPIKVTPIELDVQNNQQVISIFETIDRLDILVNNAGLALGTEKLQEGLISNWETMIDTNLKGLLYVTRAALPLMIQQNKGHIINIGSIAGHGTYVAGNVYCATKHAVKAITESLRLDFQGTKIRVSEIDPGAVVTEFSEVRWNDTERAKKFYEGFEPLVAADIADAIVYCVTRPAHVNIQEILIYPQAQAGLMEIYREGQEIKNAFEKN